MHHGKSMGNEIHVYYNVCKNTSIFRNQRGNFAKVGGKEKFPEMGENELKQENRGWSVTKKRSSEILADENLIFFVKRPNRGNFPRSPKLFSKIGGNLKQGHCLRGMDALGKDGLSHLPIEWAPYQPLVSAFKGVEKSYMKPSCDSVCRQMVEILPTCLASWYGIIYIMFASHSFP